MNIDSEFYKKIVYKKNAIEDLKLFFKFKYLNKNALLITTKSVDVKYLTSIVNAFADAGMEFKVFVSKNNFDVGDINEINKIITKNKPKLIVSLGGNKTCNIAKYFASTYSLEYVVCPTMPSGVGYFNNYCINPYDNSESLTAKHPARVFIQESIICELNNQQTLECLKKMLGFFAVAVDFVDDNMYDSDFLYDKLFDLMEKFELLVKTFDFGVDCKLELMDICLEFAEILEYVDFSKISVLNMYKIYLKTSGEINICICADMITKIINNFINKKVDYGVPDFVKIAKDINKNKISHKKTDGIKLYKQYAEICGKLKYQFIKNKTIEKYNKIVELYQNILKNIQLLNINGYKCEVNFDNLLNSIKIMPFISDCSSIIKYIAFSGAFNYI